MSLADLPAAVRASTRCVVWRRERRDGRVTKVPYMATRPHVRAAVDDPRTWCAFEVAAAAVHAGHGDGAGLVLGAGVAGVDADHTRNAATGVVTTEVMAIVALLDSYTEVSPSGDGLHVLMRGVLPPGRRRCGGVELYDGGRFFTLTGRHVAGTPTDLEERTAALAELHARLFPAPPPTPPAPGADRLAHAGHRRPAYPATDAELIARAHAARNGAKFGALWRGDASGYASRSEADLALCGMLAFWTGGDAARVDRLFRQSGLMRGKWTVARGAETYGGRTIGYALGIRR